MSSATDKSGAAAKFRRSRPRISKPNPVFVTIFVGPKKKRFVVHKSVITHYSEFFRAAFTREFKEAEDGTMTLEEESASTFEIFMHWLYYQQLPNEDLNDDEAVLDLFPHEITDGFDLEAIKLYVFGDKYAVKGLRRDVLDLVYHSITAIDGLLPHETVIDYAFNNLSPTDPICRLLVDYQCHWDPLEGTDRALYQNVVFLQAIWQRYVRLAHDNDLELDIKVCDYHEHTTEEEGLACSGVAVSEEGSSG